MVITNSTVADLALLIQRVRQNPSYRGKARYFQTDSGRDLPADVIERAVNIQLDNVPRHRVLETFARCSASFRNSPDS